MVKIIEIKNSKIPMIDKCVACIGFFDGVHIGHQKLIYRTVKLSNKYKVIPTVICFNPDPDDVINDCNNKHLTDLEYRIKLFEKFGIKQIIIIKFNNRISKISPENFINNYLNKMNIISLICGPDFSFGFKGKGKISLLKKCGDFKTVIVKEQKISNKKVSSTLIKKVFSRGDFRLSGKLLGYSYTQELNIELCVKTGGKWLIFASNRDKYVVIPKNGTYFNKSLYIKDGIYCFYSNIRLKKGQLLTFQYNYE